MNTATRQRAGRVRRRLAVSKRLLDTMRQYDPPAAATAPESPMAQERPADGAIPYYEAHGAIDLDRVRELLAD